MCVRILCVTDERREKKCLKLIVFMERKRKWIWQYEKWYTNWACDGANSRAYCSFLLSTHKYIRKMPLDIFCQINGSNSNAAVLSTLQLDARIHSFTHSYWRKYQQQSIVWTFFPIHFKQPYCSRTNNTVSIRNIEHQIISFVYGIKSIVRWMYDRKNEARNNDVHLTISR